MREQLVGSLVGFAAKMDVKLIAEGIETVEELHTLRELGVTYGQGFLFARPSLPFPSDEELASLRNLL